MSTSAAPSLYTAIIRTVVPMIAGFLLTQALRLHLHLDQATVTGEVTTGLSAAYYALFSWLEKRVSPRFGWLLGLARPPKYTAPRTSLRQALRRGSRSAGGGV